MKIPRTAVIADDKLTRYLLVPKARNDKSRFLAQAGFTQQNSDALRAAIRSLADSADAITDRSNEYGVFYRNDGELIGANGVNLPVTIIWLQRRIDNRFQFVTLKPRKEFRHDA